MEQEYNHAIYAKYDRIRKLRTAATIGAVITVGMLLYLLLATWVYSGSLREVVRCSDFDTQPAAQFKYLSDPVQYSSLDANHDGIACNNLPKY